MHGVKRSRIPPVPDSLQVERKKQEKESKRISEYRTLVAELYRCRDGEVYDEQALEGSTRVLDINPEFQTAWSIRRRILLRGILPSSDTTTQQKYLEEDLQLTNRSLKLNPKNYSVWEHRKWVLETMPDADWGMEMKMVELYLERDGRNFHSWDYRRYLIDSIAYINSQPPPLVERTKKVPKPTTESELAYTTTKIAASFSNFSAWHYRTKLLPKLWDERGWSEESEERRDALDKEFELVKGAFWVDPSDQSAWLYHRWLVGKGSIPVVRREISGIEELLAEEPDSRWCLDSLVYYKRLLVNLLGTEEGTRLEREGLNGVTLEMLRKLESVDSTRGARYRDLALHVLPARR